MKKLFTTRLVGVVALLVIWAATVGCAQRVGDIDRTQPNLVDKAQFLTDDEWYMMQTVVDTDMQATAVFASLQGDLKRVRWTVTENVLYAHSTVELADGLMEGIDDEDSRRLGVVAAFPIRGHFDVQRTYNAATGEPSNVIMENASDRPWYERQYMRVDWSRNMIDAFWAIGYLGRMAPIAHAFPQEDKAAHPHRTRIRDGIIDTVAEYSYHSNPMACWQAWGLDTAFSCEGGRMSMRHFFMRVPEEETYVPFNYTDNRLLTRDDSEWGQTFLAASIYDNTLGYEVDVECTPEVKNWILERFGYEYERLCRPAAFDFFSRFGYFRTTRVAWDRYVGTADDTRRYWVNRWNIWQTMLDEDGEVLPMSERIPRPITMHLNAEYPDFMFDAAQRTADEWDRAFRLVVQEAAGLDATELDEILEAEYGHTHMFRIVENSCHPGPLVEWRNTYGEDRGEDRASVDAIFRQYAGSANGADLERTLWGLPYQTRVAMCAELEWATETREVEEDRFDWERLGDFRYSFFNWMETDVPFAGYGPSAADPLTGEIIAANSNFNGAYIRNIANYATDLVQYFNGELDDESIRLGHHVRAQLYHDEDTATNRFGLTPEAQREMSRRHGLNPTDVSPSNFEERITVEQLDSFLLEHGHREMQHQADLHAIADAKRMERDERLVDVLMQPTVRNFIYGSMETQLAVRALATERFGPGFDHEQEKQAYLDMHTPNLHFARIEQGDRLLAERSIMTVDSMARMAETLVSYRGVADYFKGKPRADITEYFMNNMFIGTQLHEIGHNVGLRHNFAASTDALNFHDEYWDIELAVIRGEITRDEAYSLQGPLAAQILGYDVDYASQTEFQLASVMDYTGDMTGRFQGLAKYDIAALKFAYGELVEQWADDVELPNLLSWEAWISDYKELPLILGANGGGSQEEIYARGVDIIKNGRVYVPLADAMAQRRQGIMANTERWLTYDFSPGYEPIIDRAVQYEFCTDDRRGRELNCAIWDFGANQTEIVNHTFDTYRALQSFWRYRRHNIARDMGNLNGYYNRMFNTFMVTQEPFRYYSFYRWYDLGAYTDDLLRASIDSFNFYNEVLAMPEPGRYCRFDSELSEVDPNWFFELENTYVPARYHADRGNCAGYVDIPQGVGQPYNYTISQDYEQRVDRVGTFVDKLVASMMMFQISANFTQSNFLTDQRATAMSYWTTFQDELLEMMRGLLLGDYHGFAGIIEQGQYELPTAIDVATMGQGLPHSQSGKTRIFTPHSVNHEFNMLLYGLAFSSDWAFLTEDFAQYVKVATLNNEGQPFADGTPIKEFIHPVTYQVYQAPDVRGRSISGDMIDRANYHRERYLEADALFQQAQPGTSEYFQLSDVRQRRYEQMQDIVARLELSRYVFDAIWYVRR